MTPVDEDFKALAVDLTEVWGDDFTLRDLAGRIEAEPLEDLEFRAGVKTGRFSREYLRSQVAAAITEYGENTPVYNTPLY
jgi:hypothetical protein